MTPDDEIVLADRDELDNTPTGDGLQRADVILLVTLGLVIPAILLIWGWL